MTPTHDPVLDADLDAYVDNQLDGPRRIEVAAYLSGHPEKAARIMSDLRIRDELRLAMAGAVEGQRVETADAARRLERGLRGRRLLGTLRRLAAAVVLVGAGWLAHSALGPIAIGEVVASTPTPAFVADAIRAHQTETLRLAMVSQPEAAGFDAGEIRAATGIVMPAFPEGWVIRDAQVYPSQFGPAVEVLIDAGEGQVLSLFAVRPGTFDVISAVTTQAEEATAAYFQVGEVGYALVAAAGTQDLDRTAAGLAGSLY